MPTLAPLALASLAVFLQSPKAAPNDAPDRAVDATLESEIAAVESLRELDPEAADVLERYSVLLGKRGDIDGQIAYLLCALDAYDAAEVDDAKVKAATQKRLSEALTKLDSSLGTLGGARDSYLADLTWALRLYANNQHKDRNALEVAGRILRYRPSHATGKRAVDDLLARADEDGKVEANRLLGLRELRRPRAFLVDWAAQHDAWESAGKLESDGYAVSCDVGYDTLQRAARGLDQIARFYAAFYATDRALQKGKTTVALCRTREEWERVAQAPEVTSNPECTAFIQPTMWALETNPDDIKEMSFAIFAFDPRDLGRPLAQLWPFLWHEASHQYMCLATRGHQPPLWLNEGMASYFEGARMDEWGEVAVGLPARERLDDLFDQLAKGDRPLAETLGCTAPHLRGEQYSVAWGLVYYLHHERGEAGQRAPRALLSDCVRSCAETRWTGTNLFEFDVLKPLGVDLATFETRWIAAMKELHDAEAAPQERVKSLLQRAQDELTAQQEDLAWEDFSAALLRAPDDATALLGLARIARARSSRKRDKDAELMDETLLLARRAHHAALAANLDDAAENAASIAKAVDPAGFAKIGDAERTYRKKLEAVIQKQIAKGQPKTALAISRRYIDDVLGDHRFEQLAGELRSSGALALERGVRVFDGKTLAGLSASPRWFRVENGEIVVDVRRPARAPASIERSLAPASRFEGEFWLADSNTMFAVTFSEAADAGACGFIVRPQSEAKSSAVEAAYEPFDRATRGEVAQMQHEFVQKLQVHDFRLVAAHALEQPLKPRTWVRFRVLREDRNKLVFELDGRVVSTRLVESSGDDVNFGLLLYGGEARLRNLRAVELDRL